MGRNHWRPGWLMDGNALERIVRLAARSFEAPAAAVALLDGDRFLVAARHGCDLEIIPRCGSLPGGTLDRGAPSVIPDLAALDPPPPVPLIHDRPLRFYAGVPIRGPAGDFVGTLCVGDVVPRRFEEEDVALLEGLAALVSDQLRLEHEISEHRELLARLEASERRLQDFAETASDWFWEMDAELRFSWLSESVRTRFGLDPAWHYGKTRLEIAATPADREVAERVQELMRRHEPFRDFEYCRRSPTGDHWLRISGKPIFDAAGKFLGYRGTGRDVTELVREREAARAAQERYRRLVELLPDAVLLLDGERIVVANRSAARLYGVSDPTRLLGLSPIDFFSSEHLAVAKARLHRVLETGETLPPAELRLRRSDGTLVDVESSATAIEEDGRRLVLAVLRDVTARKAAERARHEAEARYRALVELSPDPVILVENGRFVFANGPAARLFGVEEPGALVGRSLYDFLPAELHPTIRARHATPLREGESLPPIELEILRPDGVRVEVEAKGSLILEGGRRMFLGVLRDIGARKAAERALREAEERWRTLVELSPEAVLLIRDGRYVFANRRAAELFGATDPAELVGRAPAEFFLEAYRPLIAARGEKLLREGGRVPLLEVQLRRLDGRVIDVETTGTFVLDGGRPAIQTILRDITERKAAERALVEAEERWRTLVEVAPIGILLYRDGCYRYANPAAARILGAEHPGELVGLDPFTLILEPYHAVIREREARLLAGGSSEQPLEIEMRRLDGGTVTIATRGAAIREGGAPAIHVLIEDVSERKRLEAELQRLAYHDSLTGLPNRALFFDRLAQALQLAEREARLGALLLLDLDGFKQVNDGLGHDAGDALLRGVARRLRRVVRRSDTVARLAGDEFALLLYPIRDPATVERVAERIHTVLALPVRHRGRVLRAKTSVGAALFPTDGTNVETLFKHADLALYRAKAQGRGGLAVVDDAMRLAFARRIRLGEELREAVEAGNFELLHELRVALEDDRPEAVEAVPVWTPPGSEPLRGAVLRELASECGLGGKLALEVLRRALDAAVARDAAGLPPLPVAVDLPIELLTNDGGVTWIRRLLEERGLTPQRLLLELDETAFADRERGSLLDALSGLRDTGVRVILDRFGLGTLSLRPLVERRVDGINFLAEPRDGSADPAAVEALAASLVEMASRLGMPVTALGVASEATRRALVALGCRYGQGPLWSDPVSSETLSRLFGGSSPGPCARTLSGAPAGPCPPLIERLPDP